MASRVMGQYSRRSFGLLEKQLSFRIMANGAWTSPVIVGGRGTHPVIAGAGIADGVTSVVRSSAGKFLITLDDTYAKVCSLQSSYQGSGDAEDLVAQVGAVSNVGTSTPVTIVIKTKTGTVNTDPATTDANTSISVDLVFEDSGA